VKEDQIYIKHIIESIELIEHYMSGITKEEYILQPQLQDAVLRRLEIIGEAAKNISANTKNQHPEIPWRLMAGMRDMIIHHYFGIDIDLVWGTVKKDLPDLKKLLDIVVHENGKS
jgi:uncharacterized protein with HEPN domain